jgi:tRNA-dihydrouridine synthase A
MLAGIDAGQDEEAKVDLAAIIDAMKDYAARHIARGGRLAHVTRHMTGLLHGMPGARLFRQALSTEATRPGAGPEVLDRAMEAAFRAAEMEAA